MELKIDCHGKMIRPMQPDYVAATTSIVLDFNLYFNSNSLQSRRPEIVFQTNRKPDYINPSLRLGLIINMITIYVNLCLMIHDFVI